MGKLIDLNADLGEMTSAEGRAAERAILLYVSSANIACGGHAGSPDIMHEMCRAAKAAGVTIGAHPAYPDRENFGRKSYTLGKDMNADKLRASLTQQIVTLAEIAMEEGHPTSYVKPHGTLYTDTAKQANLAELIVDVVKSIDPGLAIMGFPGGNLEEFAKRAKMKFAGEGFIDRRYTSEGVLTPRSQDGAVIKDQEARKAQLMALALGQPVTADDGSDVLIKARSLCLHGDSAGAVETARLAKQSLIAAGLRIKAFA